MNNSYAIQLNRFMPIDRAVKHVEERICRKKGVGDIVYFPTQAPHRGVYAPSDPYLFMAEVERHPEFRPDMTFADLGSGLGRLCFAAAHYFDRVIGLEDDQMLFEEAEQLLHELRIKNVTFRKEDFLNANLSGCKILTTYQSFFDDFPLEMSRRLERIERGTYFIANITTGMREILFDNSGRFRPVLAPDESLSTAQERPLMTYQRI